MDKWYVLAYMVHALITAVWHVPCRVAAGQVAHVSVFNATVCHSHEPGFGGELAPSCPLFARKFGPDVADAVSQLMGVTSLLREPFLSQRD